GPTPLARAGPPLRGHPEQPEERRRGCFTRAPAASVLDVLGFGRRWFVAPARRHRRLDLGNRSGRAESSEHGTGLRQQLRRQVVFGPVEGTCVVVEKCHGCSLAFTLASAV